MPKRAFTLIELLVVVLVIAILAAIGLPMFFSSLDDAKNREGMTMLTHLGEAYSTFRRDYRNSFIASDTALTNEDFEATPTAAACDATPATRAEITNLITKQMGAATLRNCGYIEPLKVEGSSYSFYFCDPNSTTSSGTCCKGARDRLAAMQGTAATGARFTAKYCAVYTTAGEIQTRVLP